MNVLFTPEAWEEYLGFQQTDNASLKRINLLIKAIQRDPFQGLGKPEPLKHNLSGFWSRRITHEHRLVYSAQDGEIQIIQCRYHY